MAGKPQSSGGCIECDHPERMKGRRKCRPCVLKEWSANNAKKGRDAVYNASFGTSNIWLRRTIMSGFDPNEMSKDEVLKLRQSKAAFNSVEAGPSAFTQKNTKANEKHQEEIDRKRAEYLANGGEVTHCPPGGTGYVAHSKTPFVINPRKIP